MAKLTVKRIETLKPDAVRKEIPDGLISGLYFVLQPSGTASWALRYRYGGTNRKLTIGPYPAIGLGLARELASRAVGEIAQGRDPAGEKKAARAAARIPDDRDLVEKVAEQFIERYAKANTRENTWSESERLLNREVVSAWKGRRLAQITKADVHELLDGIVDRAPIVANKTFAVLRRMCAWAVERGIVESSPCAGIRAPAPEKSRDRVLSDHELAAVCKATDALGWPFGPATKLMILTGQRRDEVTGMRWGEIDLASKTWIIPRERAKNNQAHTVPLSRAAATLLESLPRIAGKEGFVFSTTGETSVSGFSRAKRRLNALLPEDMPAWVIHDLRRTVATGMARLGIDLPVIERVLNHVSGTFAGVVGVYQRHSFADEKRAALDAWARHIAVIVSGQQQETSSN